MAGVARPMCMMTVLSVVVSIAGLGAYADTQSGRLPPWRIERDIQRFKTVATDNVMTLLAIEPGMTVLDIGAGTGQFAYEFARRLNGTGKVFATDANASCVDYMKKESNRRSLSNLDPVLVKKDGVDEFYGKHKYDLITIFHVSMTYENRVDYLREMRGFLSVGGRLILILYKIPTLFSPGDFTGDFAALTKELLLEPPESPYSRILKDITRKRILNHPGAEPAEELTNAIVEDFNEMLSDTRFAAHFSNGSVFRKEASFFPGERSYADWYLLPFPDRGVSNRDIKIQSASAVSRAETINKLLIVQRYRKFLKRDGLFMSGFTPSIKAAFEKAGYRLEREYPDVVPFEDLIVFSAQNPKVSSAP